MKHYFRRGFATFTALVLMSLVGVALAGLTLTFSADAHRTAREAADAQLRQLLLAGSLQAKQLLNAPNPAAGQTKLALPSALGDDAVTINVTTPGHVQITATAGKSHVEREENY